VERVQLITLFILILLVPGNAVAMQEFGTRAACETARQAAIELHAPNFVRGVCVPKG
jgi:hypothetical protein